MVRPDGAARPSGCREDTLGMLKSQLAEGRWPADRLEWIQEYLPAWGGALAQVTHTPSVGLDFSTSSGEGAPARFRHYRESGVAQMMELLVSPACERCGGAFAIGETVSVRKEGIRRRILCSRCWGLRPDRFVVVNRVEVYLQRWDKPFRDPQVQTLVMVSQMG